MKARSGEADTVAAAWPRVASGDAGALPPQPLLPSHELNQSQKLDCAEFALPPQPLLPSYELNQCVCCASEVARACVTAMAVVIAIVCKILLWLLGASVMTIAVVASICKILCSESALP